MTRLRFVMEDPAQQLANSVAPYIVDQLCDSDNRPADVIVAGFTNVTYPGDFHEDCASNRKRTLRHHDSGVVGCHGRYIGDAGLLIVDRIPGTGKNWDYASVDAPADRLYLAQQGVTALDLKTNKITHGLGGRQDDAWRGDLWGMARSLSTISATKTVTIFKGATGEVLATIPTAESQPGQRQCTLSMRWCWNRTPGCSPRSTASQAWCCSSTSDRPR